MQRTKSHAEDSKNTRAADSAGASWHVKRPDIGEHEGPGGAWEPHGLKVETLASHRLS